MRHVENMLNAGAVKIKKGKGKKEGEKMHKHGVKCLTIGSSWVINAKQNSQIHHIYGPA